MNENKEILTEVTSIKEANKNGANIVVPNAEELISKASASFISSRKMFNNLFSQLSARGKNRVMNAVLDLPQDKLPVMLKDELEKAAFVAGQKIINARFTITYYHILKQLQEEKEKINNANKTTTEETVSEESESTPKEV